MYNNQDSLTLGRVVQLQKPMYTLLENIDFTYFARVNTNNVNSRKGESKKIYWFTKEGIESNDDIKPHVKEMALKALQVFTVIIDKYK